MSKIVGIDLGTTNSLVAVMEGGEAIVIPSSEGNPLIPSVVGFTKAGERLIGEVAKRQAVSNPERTIISIKRHMGTDYKVKIDDKDFTPQEISAMILSKLKTDAEAYLGEEVDKAVITVPAYFNDSQRQATKDAGTIAGLEVVRIINEPTASSLAYGLDKMDTQKILVYDLGGGTFDVTILEIGGGVFEVISTCGDTHLGGDDWDQRVMDYLIDEFKKNEKIDLRTDRVAMQRLKEASEKAKIELSDALTATISLPFISSDSSGPKHLEMELTRSKFQELTLDLVERTAVPAKKALEDASLAAGDIDRVLMVGGSSRMPAIQDIARKVFGTEPCTEIDPDKVVALGAGIQAGILAGEVKDMVLLDVTSLSLGIETTGGVFTRLIPRNSSIPTTKSRLFTTIADGQSTVEVHVMQGEREKSGDNMSLGRFELTNIPPAPRGVPQIEVTFEIDANGIVNVTAKDLATGNKQKITITSPTNLSKDDIDRMTKEAAIYKEDDARFREKSDIMNKAETELYTAERTLRMLGAEISPQVRATLEECINTLKELMKKDDLQPIRLETETLVKIMYSLSTEVYTKKEMGDLYESLEPKQRPTIRTEVKSEKQEAKPSPKEEEDIFSWFKKKDKN